MYIFLIKKKWFEMIISGDKQEEYREIKPFYTSILEKIIDFSSITMGFRNGYSNRSSLVYERFLLGKDLVNGVRKKGNNIIFYT